MKRTWIPAALLVAAAALPASADDWRKPGGTSNVAASGKVIGAKLECWTLGADGNRKPCREVKGPCPVVLHFGGSIETNGPTPVKYIFKRSDNAIDTIVKTINFTASPFHQAIADQTWTLGGPGMNYSGWEQIYIESPNAGFTSNQAPFHIICDGSPNQPGGGTTGGTQPGPNDHKGKPDLVITAFGFTGPTSNTNPPPACAPHTVVYNFRATVKNIGTAASPSSASLGNKALVQAMAQDKAGWGNGAMLNALAPGASQTVDIPVYYLMDDPAFMTHNAPHKFLGIADPLGLVDESNEGNNNNGPINMGAPAGCKK